MIALYLLALLVVSAGVVFLALRSAKKRNPPSPRTYDGPIRFTSPDGRNMKIIRKDDGSFEMIEE